VVTCLKRGENDLHVVRLLPLAPHHIFFIKIQIALTFLAPAYPGYLGNEPVKRVTVFLCLSEVPPSHDFRWCCSPRAMHVSTRMWANAQRDGRCAEHRWRPLFNVAKFG